MRRPTPLPAPVRPTPRTTADTATEAAASRGAVRAAPRAPVIPLTREHAEDDRVADATAAPVGLRDVWRAARDRRRALRTETRRFTARTRRRRAVWLSAVGAVALLVAATFGVSYSPLFAVRSIDVVGVHALSPSAVRHALRGELGTPLPLVSVSAVTTALEAFSRVQSFSLQAQPPHELVVHIVERTPVGVVKTATGYDLVDAAGVTVDTVGAPAAGRPVITARGGVHSAAFRAAGRVLQEIPAALRAKVSAVTATSADAVTLTLAGGHTTVVWGSAQDSARKALVLGTIMRARPMSGVHVYDVSAPDAVVVR